jgi:hypothetical protein
MDHSPKNLMAGSPRRAEFMAALGQLERWLTGERIPYAIFGSVAASALIDQGLSLDFNRPGAHDPTQSMPDVDLLVPRANLGAVRNYAHAVRCGEFPVSIDTFWSECWIDFRPKCDHSYLTHRKVRLPVRTDLFAGCTASLLGRDVTVLDPRIVLHLYSVVGVARQKDVPRITGLVEVIASGSAASRFTDQDCQVFGSFMLARKRQYPLFFASKRAWVLLLDALPPAASHALVHHVQMPANEMFRLVNRSRGEKRAVGPGHGAARNSRAHRPM